MAARDAARTVVEKNPGATLEDIQRGQSGSFSKDLRIQIGSSGAFGCRATYGADSITVGRVAGVDCCYCFRLSDIYAEVRSGMRQAGLPL